MTQPARHPDPIDHPDPSAAGPHAANSDAAGPHAAGAHAANSDAAGPATADPSTADPHAADPSAAGPHAAGPHAAAGPDAAGPIGHDLTDSDTTDPDQADLGGGAQAGPQAVEFVHRAWPAEASALGHIRRELVAWIGPLGLSADEVDDVVLAVDEAAANVVEHAYSPDDPGSVELTLWTEPGALCIEITDHGTWNPTEAPGRGIDLMQRMVGAVLIHVDERGSRVLLRHPLPGARERGGGHGDGGA
ncbi:ATP-binding protein [Pseudonocardia sulfidoxydans]|uniref:ATP-binding protein n=1 Tax=Pseudonocardia sulfidoxydans TaxID=54011 RepID=UPI0035EFA7CF